MTDDIYINKSETIRRCLKRIREEYQESPQRLENFTIQDSIVLNLQRACEASIDLAMHNVAARKLGVPQHSREGFDLLEKAGLIQKQTSERMRAMVGFRNVAVHDYREIQIPILKAILESHLNDFESLIQDLNPNKS